MYLRKTVSSPYDVLRGEIWSDYNSSAEVSHKIVLRTSALMSLAGLVSSTSSNLVKKSTPLSYVIYLFHCQSPSDLPNSKLIPYTGGSQRPKIRNNSDKRSQPTHDKPN